jgi:hypothetical protein
MKRTTYLLPTIILYLVTTLYPQTDNRKLLFIGLQEDGSPSLSGTFNKLMLDKLETIAGLVLTDHEKTLQYRHQMHFSRYTKISEELISELETIVSDSLLIMWGSIVTSEIRPARKHVIGCVLKGKLIVNLIIYDLPSKRFLYNGNIASDLERPTSAIFFSSPEKVIHISSTERVTINELLLNKVILASIGLIDSLFRNNQLHQVPEQVVEQKHVNEPSISDVFSVPSVEPPQIDDTDENNPKKKTAPIKTQTPDEMKSKRNASTIKTK